MGWEQKIKCWVGGGRGKHDVIGADIHRVGLDAEVQMTGGASCTPDGWRQGYA